MKDQQALMQVIYGLAELRQCVTSWRQAGQKIGFVPTMGNLHQGHLSLVELAAQNANKVITSIFVNPTQFNDKTDLAAYPRTLEADIEKLNNTNCDVVFVPDVSEVYPGGTENHTVVTVPVITERLCGAHRPGHFDGVATVVSKLFNMVQPDLAVFGQKDYQQLLVIKQLVADLDMPIEIIAGETYRESNGLAMSSRNQYLTAEQKRNAAQLITELNGLKQQIVAGNRNYLVLCQQAENRLQQAGFKPDYIEVCRIDNLLPAQAGDTSLRILAAAYLGKARLIDNIACDIA